MASIINCQLSTNMTDSNISGVTVHQFATSDLSQQYIAEFEGTPL
jgi:hypothetical protein